MCQINTDPMKSQVGYLNVVVPPDILDYPTSADMIVREGANIHLRCVARGSPEPTITWRREAGEAIRISDDKEVTSVEGPVLNITRVNRQQMGPYLCIASNGLPPSVSKRIMLIVHFPPMIWIQNQLVGAYEGQKIILECYSEAFPKSISYWTDNKGEIIPQSERFDQTHFTAGYKTHMKLTIRSIEPPDYGNYKCVSKNSLGDTDGTIQVFAISRPLELNHSSKKRFGKKFNEATDGISEEDEILNNDDGNPVSLLQENGAIAASNFHTKTRLVCFVTVVILKALAMF